MKKAFYSSAILVLVLLMAGCSSGDEKGATGAVAADFSLESTLGRKVRLSDYHGRVVILDFWATWCPPCRRGIPDLISIQNEYKDKVQVIGISLDRETKGNVGEFISQQGINYPIAFPDEEVVKAYGGIEAIPTTFIIDKSGTIAYKHVGLVSKSVLLGEIGELLK